MSKTFREVIRDIKPNEVYRHVIRGMGRIDIKCTEDNSIVISTPCEDTKIKPSYEFEKIKSRVPFDVAIEEYYKGKEIESAYSGNKYKIIDYVHYVKISFNSEWEATTNMQINEIRDDWYIND